MTQPILFSVCAIACMLAALVYYRRTDTRSILAVTIGIIVILVMAFNWDALNHLVILSHLLYAFFHATNN